MSNDVIIGYDGKPRCAWAGADDTALGRYHDEVWGTRTDDESAMFEALTLGCSGACLDVPSSDESPSCSSAHSAEPSPAPSRRAGQEWTKASRSALIVAASVVGMPWGNPW